MYRSIAVYISTVLMFGICTSVFSADNAKARKSIDPMFVGKCTQVDSAFAYFKDRSLDSIAEELKVNGYTSVSITSTGGGKFPLADMLKKYGIQSRLLIVPMNGTYDSSSLPSGWEKWRIVCRDPGYKIFEYFCLNDPDFRIFMQKRLVDTLLQNPAFAAIDLPEPQIPSIGGPDDPGYACFCDDCRQKFLSMHPEETDLPNFTDPSSPKYWKTDVSLYKKWIDFRVNTVTDFLNFLVNGPGGIRGLCPKIKVITWTLGCQSRGKDVVKVERENQGMDAAAVVSKVKPYAHCIQTDWPDWSLPILPANHVKNYEPYLKSIRSVNKKIPVIIQTDSGSLPAMLRSFEWLAEFDKIAKQIGFTQTFDYQYHLASDFYTKAPRLATARLSKSTKQLTLVFDMYLDPAIANDSANYSLSRGRVISAKADGNLVLLEVDGATVGLKVTVNKAGNNPERLIHKGYEQKISGPVTVKAGRE